MRLILATESKFKIRAFRRLGIPFEAVASHVDERDCSRVSPEVLVSELACRKARVIASRYPDAVVVGLDSIACFRGQILEKPDSLSGAADRLRALSGNVHEAVTGICIIRQDASAPVARVVKTKVLMRTLSDMEIDNYVSSDPDILHICLGYDPEGTISASFVERIEGSYQNLLSGVPLEVLSPLLSTRHSPGSTTG